MADDGRTARVYKTCLLCSTDKLKCDKVRPVCTRCATMGHKCEYEYSASRTKVQLLQAQIKELESRIEAAEARVLTAAWPSENSSIQSYSILLPAALPPKYLPSSSLEPQPTVHIPTCLELTSDVLSRLLDIFVQRSFRCGFHLHLPRVLQSFKPGTCDTPVAALFYAMLLIASYFATEHDLKAWEATFLERTKSEIESNLTQAHESIGNNGKYNPLYYLQAMFLLSQYSYLRARLPEGYVYQSQAMQFIELLGIHKLNSRVFSQYTSSVGLGLGFGVESRQWRPRDPLELGEAINLCWRCITLDLSGSIVNGLSPAIPLSHITTVWPCPLSDFDDGKQLLDDGHSVASLLHPKLGYIIADVALGDTLSLFCKSNVLIYRAKKLESEWPVDLSLGSEWWKEFKHTCRLIERLLGTLPSVHIDYNFGEKVIFIVSYAGLSATLIQILSPLADHEFNMPKVGIGELADKGLEMGDSYKRCVKACRHMALATSQAEHIDWTYMPIFIGTSWLTAANFIAKWIPRLKHAELAAHAHEMDGYMLVIERGMDRLVAVNPILALQHERLQSLRTW